MKMSAIDMTSLANKLQKLELSTKSQNGQEVSYGQALREAIVCKNHFMEVEVLKSLGDLHLQKAKLSKDSAEFDKAAALYAAALLRCTDPDMGQTLEHRIGYMEKLSRQLLQGYTPHFRWLSPDYWGTAESNVLRVAEICDKLVSDVGKWHSAEETYTEMLVMAVGNRDVFLELEVVKSLGDLYLDKGKKTSDVSQFSKAAAMYNKALRTCGDPETKLTLEHRIRYMDKIKEVVKKKPSPNKPRERERRPDMEQQCGNVMITLGTDISQDHHLYPDRISKSTEPGMGSVAAETVVEEKHKDRLYKDRLKEGDSSLARADLDSAEQHFAAALKTVHVRDPTAQQYQREVEPLCKLGDVYSKRGQQTGDGGDFVKAAALYSAAIARSEDQILIGNIATAIREVEKLFFKCILDVSCAVQDNTDKHKKQLKEMRDQIKLEMETIDQQLDPYVHDEDDPCVKEIEAKRAQAVRQLFERIAQQRKEFISLLVEECIGLMGPPPCKYALIGLGSQATGLVTPYSDLEFAILVEKESKECLGYFRNLTHYLHLKVVNLGETILPALGIKSLNDFNSGDDSGYYDSVTPRGFAFDGSMPKASKTPLGRQGTIDKPHSELICTPENMVSKLQNDVTLYLKEGYHLATILRNPCLIAGDQGLIDTYMAITANILQAERGKLAQQLAQETMKEDIKTYSSEQTVTAKLIDVKKEIYRFPAVAVDYLALSSQSHIMPTTVWKTIEEMETKQVISPNNAHHLTVLTSISAELRLKTYIANGGQKENLSALAAMETELHGQESSLQTNTQESAFKVVFHLPNNQQLFRYYYSAVPLKRVLQEKALNKQAICSISDLYDNSPMVQGVMYSELCKYEQAISCYHEALKKADGTEIGLRVKLFNDIGLAYHRVGDVRNGINYHKQSLQMLRSIYGQNTAHPQIATSLNNLGSAWYHQGDYRKAISYHEQALQMRRSIYGHTTAHLDTATSLNNLGGAYSKLTDYKKAISYLEQALQMLKSIHGQSTAHPDIASSLNNLGKTCDIHEQSTDHPDIASSLNNLGKTCGNLGNYSKAIAYHEEALQMHSRIYGQSSAHPHIASSLNNLGEAYGALGDYKKAIIYHEQALQMRKSIHGQSTAHPDIANSLNNLGGACDRLGDYREAISYYEQALQMYRSIYGQNTPHPDIATSLNNLGGAWLDLGDYRKVISYHEQALQMYKSIYDQSTAHPSIAKSLNNLASACFHLNDHRKAISYYEKALQMERIIYGKSAPHPSIATSLNHLGIAWSDLGDYRKAISYHEQALQMCRSIYGDRKAHPDIAYSLKSLGSAWSDLGNYRKAISYYEQALQMYRSVYGQGTSHPDIAYSLNDIGTAWNHLGDYRKAISYYEQGLQMYTKIYGQSEAHPLIATLLSNMGSVWNSLDDQSKAISYHEQALQMRKRIYGQSTAHSDIANSLNNLGTAWLEGDCKKAIRYYDQALEMRRSVYGPNTAHRGIATTLNNLAKAWSRLGDYRKAISYHEQALQMFRCIYGQGTAHPDIATSLGNMGEAWSGLGDYRKAISYQEQALQMKRSIYGKSTAHADIATSLNNLAHAWYNLGDHKRALSLCQEALAMVRQIYPQNKSHPMIRKMEANIAYISSKLTDS